jgi:hypothetical protein
LTRKENDAGTDGPFTSFRSVQSRKETGYVPSVPALFPPHYSLAKQTVPKHRQEKFVLDTAFALIEGHPPNSLLFVMTILVD